METLNTFFGELYQNFNDCKIDIVISNMTDDVKWANGMEGGHVYGHDGVKEYWKRQFSMVSANVTPLKIDTENEVVKIKVHQVVHDLNGQLLADEMVYHFFNLKENKIVEFNIGEKITN
ncbi:MAG: nuclear transport factor 2 family protein [Bacteroidota bacterium]